MITILSALRMNLVRGLLVRWGSRSPNFKFQTTPASAVVSILVGYFLLGCLTGSATPPPAGVAPVMVPAGGFAIDGDLIANAPAASVGDWFLMTNVASGTGAGVLNAAGLPLNGSFTFHFTDPYNANDSVFKGGYKWYEDPN